MTSLYRTINLIIKQFDSLVKVTLAFIYSVHFGIKWNMERVNTYTSTRVGLPFVCTILT